MFGREKSTELPLAIKVLDLKQRLDQGSPETLLLDCREPAERAIAVIEPSLFIPMRQVPERMEELESYRNHNLVIYCHAGVRSLKVTQFLRQQGFAKVQNLSGGIDAWSREVDPSVPQY